MFKNLFITLFALISSPSIAWKKLATRTEKPDVFLNRYYYPLVCITAISVFVCFFTQREFDLEKALKMICVVFVKFFVGLFMAAFIINELFPRFFGKEKDLKLVQLFVGYTLSIPMIVAILINVMPDFSFLLRFAPLYIIYIVWEAGRCYLGIPDKKQVLFVILSSLIILLSPDILEKIMILLMPGIEIKAI